MFVLRINCERNDLRGNGNRECELKLWMVWVVEDKILLNVVLRKFMEKIDLGLS